MYYVTDAKTRETLELARMDEQRRIFLAQAQSKARRGVKLTRADIRLLRIETDRLQDLALARWEAEQQK